MISQRSRLHAIKFDFVHFPDALAILEFNLDKLNSKSETKANEYQQSVTWKITVAKNAAE